MTTKTAARFLVIQRDDSFPISARRTLYLTADRQWSSLLVAALRFDTWRKAHNAAVKHDGLTTPEPEWTYNEWVDRQAAKIEEAMRDHGRRGTASNDLALYVIPSDGAREGDLIMAREIPPQAVTAGRLVDVVWFPAQGTAVMNVPYPHLRSLLWDACRSVPICPTA